MTRTAMERFRSLPVDCRRELRQAALWAGGAAVLDAACGLLLVPLLGTWFSEGEVPWSWVMVLFSATLLQGLVLYLASRRGYLAGGRLAFALVRHLVQHLPRLAPPALRKIAAPEGLLRGPVLHSMAIPAHLLGPLVSAVATPACVVLGLFFLDGRVAGGLVLAGLVLAALMRWTGQHTLEAETARSRAERGFAEQIQIFAEHQALLRASGRSGPAQRTLGQGLEALQKSTSRLLARGLPVGLTFSLAVQAICLLGLLGGTWAVAQQTFDGARLVALLVLLARFIEPLTQLTHLDQALRGASRALDTLVQILTLPPLESPEQGEQPRDSGLRAKALGWNADDGRALLTDITLTLEPGSLSVIVGPTGAGKSSLLALLGRLHDPDQGAVALGGVDVRRLDERTLASSRTFVFQEGGLFRGTVAWNLRMAKINADEEDLRRAAEAAGLLADIEALPQGWETDVGPAGAFLSGGQRRRLCLARAFLSPAPLVLLDEPTAGLDALSESRVIQSLTALRGTRTVVSVTHTPALAERADQVLVLERGCLRLRGCHEALCRQDAWYARFAGCEEPSTGGTARKDTGSLNEVPPSKAAQHSM
ncbi:ABC transporter ATP-binding protein [Rhodospirillum sp. A1_3_36]|uniref:ABC transporter ATP-binding protein n=1 Tax=Rhodospirillum sp. A1_3_36 TaxID=3391666 RepID=UPI0039A5A985